MNKKILVEVVPGHSTEGVILENKAVPIHADDNPNGGFTLLREGDPAMEVYESTTIRRAIRDKDLRVTEQPKVQTAKTAKADTQPAASSAK